MLRHTFTLLGSVSLAAFVVAAGTGCETGWDVDGRVNTAAAPDKTRPLYVYSVDEVTIDPEALQTASASLTYYPLALAAAIPADGLPFAVHGLGCHRGSFAVVAWAPATAAPADTGPTRPFEPRAGDYVAFSDVRHPYCGVQSHPEKIVLVLDGTTYPVR